jgi:hypothetical protein
MKRNFRQTTLKECWGHNSVMTYDGLDVFIEEGILKKIYFASLYFYQFENHDEKKMHKETNNRLKGFRSIITSCKKLYSTIPSICSSIVRDLKPFTNLPFGTIEFIVGNEWVTCRLFDCARMMLIYFNSEE